MLREHTNFKLIFKTIHDQLPSAFNIRTLELNPTPDMNKAIYFNLRTLNHMLQWAFIETISPEKAHLIVPLEAAMATW